MVWSPQVRRMAREGSGADVYVVGHELVDDFLEFAASRARPNTVRAYAHDLKAFFTVVAKDPVEVRAKDSQSAVGFRARTAYVRDVFALHGRFAPTPSFFITLISVMSRLLATSSSATGRQPRHRPRSRK